jgi:hypothetical protein
MEERNLTEREKRYWHESRHAWDVLDQVITEVIDLMLEGDLTQNQIDWIYRNCQSSSTYNHGDAYEWLMEVLNEYE